MESGSFGTYRATASAPAVVVCRDRRKVAKLIHIEPREAPATPASGAHACARHAVHHATNGAA